MTVPGNVILEATKTGELIQVNMGEIKTQVADQIRAFLLNMTPREAFDQIIDIAWNRLTKPRVEKVRTDHYGPEKTVEKPSELEEMVTTEMRKILMARVEEWGKTWATRDLEEKDAVLLAGLREIANECAKAHLASVGESIFSRVLDYVRTARNCEHCGESGIRNQSCKRCGRYSA